MRGSGLPSSVRLLCSTAVRTALLLVAPLVVVGAAGSQQPAGGRPVAQPALERELAELRTRTSRT